ncbi:hypothetical protein KQI77_04820 [Clostridium sp. MSJ-8]|uniref:hypothetical protein n=1 Tax=Clostridium sp. MSJ-8 TaxID=2841510 RepID=UPI001C0F1A85|nr:hypothetical protein [Clostridium sp. MSJ-8]MBU5487485.1 hypothetical protein [Clostridium sp. MSJ-8]
MGKCPFWSTSKKSVKCYSECPMNNDSEDEVCLFKEHINGGVLEFKDIIEIEHDYDKKEEKLDFSFLRTSNF